jgi:hypothetical protein
MQLRLTQVIYEGEEITEAVAELRDFVERATGGPMTVEEVTNALRCAETVRFLLLEALEAEDEDE